MVAAKIKILIVDDEVDLAYLYSKRLQKVGYEVSCYHQGNSAVQTARDKKPDVILLDIKLPGMSGIEVFQKFKEDENLARIPVIFLSAMHDEEHHCLNELKADGFIRKPCESQSLLKAIDKALAETS